MAIPIPCPDCEELVHDLMRHKCSRRAKPKKQIPSEEDSQRVDVPCDPARDRRREEMPAVAASHVKTVLVGVRMTVALAKKLDDKRGGMTRPAKICEILEEHL